MRTTVWLWQWRRNELRRRSDTAQAWIALVTSVLVVGGAPAAGMVAAHGVDGRVDGQLRGRHPNRAVLTADAVEGGSASARTGVFPRAAARWTTLRGEVRSAAVTVAPGARAGDSVVIWTDAQGRVVDGPVSRSEMAEQEDAAGALAGVAACTTVFALRGAVVAQLNRRRSRDWDREWARFEPQWNRRQT